MNAFFFPLKQGINFAKIRGFKVTDYNSGLKNYLGWDWAYEKGILFTNDNPLEEIKEAIENKALDTNNIK